MWHDEVITVPYPWHFWHYC